jgi:hypothetical protein
MKKSLRRASVRTIVTGITGAFLFFYTLAGLGSVQPARADETLPPPITQGGGGAMYMTLFITATPVSNSQINVTWPLVSGALYYYVYNGTTTMALVRVGDGIKGSTNVHFEHINLTPATKYYYKVEAYDGSGLLVTSYIVDATTFPLSSTPSTTSSSTPSVYTPLSPPSPVTAIAKSPNEVGVQWPQTSSASGYQVARSVNGGSYEGTSKNVSTPNYTDTDVVPGSKYCYKVRSVNTNLEQVSSESVESCVTPSPTGYYNPSEGYNSSYPSSNTPLTIGSTRPTVDACGTNDTVSPARILNPQSDIKFPSLPRTAVFRRGAGIPFTYCYRGTLAMPVKIIRGLYNQQGILVSTQAVGNYTLRSGQVFSLSTSQLLGRTLVQGNYQVRIQIVDKTVQNYGDEPQPGDKVIADNAFIVSVITDPSLTPQSQLGNGSLMVPQNPTSAINFPFFTKRNTFRPGENLMLPVTFKNTSNSLKHLTIESRLSSAGTTITTQTRTVNLGALRTLNWTAAQPLITGLSPGQFTFTIIITDTDTGAQLDSNSFNFMLSM